MIGEKRLNASGQEYMVVSEGPRKKNGNATWVIRFTETGYETTVETVQMRRGKIKDRYAKDVLGVASIGMAAVTPNRRAYTVWYGMIDRCYNPNYHQYRDYGGKGVYVCERWLCFEHFLSDLPYIDGYDKEAFESGKLQLDKDRKHRGDGPKCYSRINCMLLSQFENSSQVDRSKRRKSFIAISPDGQRIEATGIREFAREHGLIKQGIISCLNGRARIHKGWKFEKVRED